MSANLNQDPHRLKDEREKILELAIGREVRAHRRQQNITVAELAQLTGISIGMVSKIENGNTSPSLSTLQTLSNALGVTLTSFFRRFEESRSAIHTKAGEGVEMGLDGGDVVDPKHLKNIHKGNLDRLLVWMSVGEDAVNGLWAIYGARLGCHMTNIQRKDWDWKNVRDFDWLTNFFKTELFPEFEGGNEMCVNTGMTWDWNKLKAKTVELGKDIRGVLDLEISDLDKTASRFFKTVYKNPSRLGAMVKEENVVDTIG